ncbi:hypothetical protein [Deefgea piscis]|uniref:hypothetical protein n=1 Tax=Deefgea piscis TaxID=2739061 RepID=UPI001C7E9114|nr:hypothetical protein [Deefgea piscis]QZA80848.1 hypothetical protein K4H25_15360 [Deefgea piscis]
MLIQQFDANKYEFKKFDTAVSHHIKYRDFHIDQLALHDKVLAHLSTPVESHVDLILRLYVILRSQKKVAEELRVLGAKPTLTHEYTIPEVSAATRNATTSDCSCKELIELANVIREKNQQLVSLFCNDGG